MSACLRRAVTEFGELAEGGPPPGCPGTILQHSFPMPGDNNEYMRVREVCLISRNTFLLYVRTEQSGRVQSSIPLVRCSRSSVC